MSSRNIADLDPRFAPMAQAFVAECARQHFDVLIYCTYRSRVEQDALYAQGRTIPGRIVTEAKGGQSAHNYGLAFDGCPILCGKPLWSEPLTGDHWQEYGHIGKACGMEWGAEWPGNFKEGPHLEMANWKQIAGVNL